MKNDIIENLETILNLSDIDFENEYRKPAFEETGKLFGNKVFLTGILALGNYCVNDCLYCGLRSKNPVPRFRLTYEQLENGVDYLENLGIKRLFLISGEDPLRKIEEITNIIGYAAGKGFYITIGAGVFPKEILKLFYNAGASEYCLKFETASRELFRKVKPSADYDQRIRCINEAAETGFKIATGGIVGLEGQRTEDIIVDFKYTLTFNPAWIPIVPYLPAPGTPMAVNNPPGDIDLTLRLISLFRLLLPKTLITAGQPGKNSKLGFADPAGNTAAIKAGANIFFIDATPEIVRKDFSIVGGRALAAYDNIIKIISDNGLELMN